MADKQSLSREFLEEVWQHAREKLPGWMYAVIRTEARARAGGRAAHRVDGPTVLEKVALGEMRPSILRGLNDDEISMAWLRLNQWFAAARKQGRSIEDIVNAALWVMNELKRRGVEVKPSDLTAEVETFRETTKAQAYLARLKKLPEEVMVIRDFVSVVGSTAKGHPNPSDLDVLVRAEWDKEAGNVHVRADNVWLPIRNVLDPNKRGDLHWISGSQGSHDDFIPLYDLVLRRRDSFDVEVVKEDEVKIDLGCGSNKPERFIGIDLNASDQVDMVHDLSKGIPMGDASVDVVRANHLLEHLVDKEAIMAEIYRVLKPGGEFRFEIPSTEGEGAFAHPDHKSFWNKAAFAFWTNPKLVESRPLFEAKELRETKRGTAVYVSGILLKPANVQKSLSPMSRFQPPKPTMARFTELFDVSELWKWVEPRVPVAIEPKLNGFRGVAHRKGDQVELWFEGQIGKNKAANLPGAQEILKSQPGDYVLDVDVAIEKNGKRVPRIELATLNAEKPELEEGEKIVITAFDVPYLEEDLSGLPFEERRHILEQKVKLPITPVKWISNLNQLRAAAKWAFGFDRSEGLMAKSARGKYETNGSTNEWSKLKRIAELKVIVLGTQKAGESAWNYFGGLLPGDSDWVNISELDSRKYINLGGTFNTGIRAKLGDVLTVEILELIPDDTKKTLIWLGARVIDIDTSRTQPYFANQALDIARRAQVLQKEVKIVPSAGPKGALLAFVGASPGRVEMARGEPFCGLTRETLDEKYLHPLGMSRDEVVMTNAVPELLLDDRGRVREPTSEEADKWKDWLFGELDSLRPHIIVALGQTAGKALGNRADFVMPHPAAVRRFGDSGEVARKVRQIKRRLAEIQKQAGEEGGETRGEVAQRLWEEHWQDRIPSSGKGRFVYQHHWRGLSEDESKLSDKQLLNTNHSIHGDIRLEGDDGLWGWAVFLGGAPDNARVGGDKLIALKEDENLRLAPKLLQPKEWLDVGKPAGGTIQKPGEPGSTEKTWSKFFALDHGTYQIGVVLQHAVEIFLAGQHLKGRYLITYPRLQAERVWLIDKPKTQTPRAETEDLADVISEQERKGRRYVIWAKPGERPVKYDTRSGEAVKSEFSVPIKKADPIKRIIYGAVIDPYGKFGATPDAHNDWIPPADVEKSAHEYLKGPRVVGMRHRTKANASVVESWIEPYESRAEYLKAMRGEDHRVLRRAFGDDVIHSGSWILGVELGEEEWEAFQSGDINAFSPGGVGFRSPITQSMMPKIQFVDLVPKEA